MAWNNPSLVVELDGMSIANRAQILETFDDVEALDAWPGMTFVLHKQNESAEFTVRSYCAAEIGVGLYLEVMSVGLIWDDQSTYSSNGGCFVPEGSYAWSP